MLARKCFWLAGAFKVRSLNTSTYFSLVTSWKINSEKLFVTHKLKMLTQSIKKVQKTWNHTLKRLSVKAGMGNRGTEWGEWGEGGGNAGNRSRNAGNGNGNVGNLSGNARNARNVGNGVGMRWIWVTMWGIRVEMRGI